jgi:hypothetical protein
MEASQTTDLPGQPVRGGCMNGKEVGNAGRGESDVWTSPRTTTTPECRFQDASASKGQPCFLHVPLSELQSINKHNDVGPSNRERI